VSQHPSVEQYERDVESLFDRTSRTYDALNHLLSFNVDRAWRSRLVSRSGAAPGSRILDVCTGTGDVAIGLARRFPQARVEAVDFSTAMVERGRSKAARLGLSSSIAFQVADALALPFPNGSFDVVCISFGLRTLPDHRRGIQEMTRVARAGGRVMILEFEQPPGTVFGRLYRWYLYSVMPFVGSLLSGYRASYVYLYDSIERFPGPQDLLGLMGECGLGKLESERLAGGIAWLFLGTKGG
jgi:demethylmenaquinone methyltransferase/2-methoxy-6-polyprenyl-1,4-benzoquinol methylase